MLHDAHEVLGHVICSAVMDKLPSENLAALAYLVQATNDAAQELINDGTRGK
jgi:hypothetical protein